MARKMTFDFEHADDVARAGGRFGRRGGFGTSEPGGGKSGPIGKREPLPDDNEGNNEDENKAILATNTPVSLGGKIVIGGSNGRTVPSVPDLSKPPSLVISEAPIYESVRPDESGRPGGTISPSDIFRKPPAIFRSPPTIIPSRGGPNPVIGELPVVGPPLPPGPVTSCPC